MLRQHASRTKMSTKKKVAATSAAVLIAALLLGGAFAWTDFSQAFKNLFHGTATPDVLLHDDFAPGKNKDVYVENTGETDLVVRVQFAEFLQVGNDVKIGTDAKDASTWRVRQWAGTTIGSDGTIPATDNYHIWLMSGEQKWYLPGTSEIGDVEYNGAVTGGNGNTTEETLASAPVVLLTEYQAHPENYDPATGFWILDDTADGNGWCYWSKLLPAGKATNLLLDNVTLDPENKPDDNYAYNIDVRLQAANKTEAYKLADKGDISDAAKELTHDLAADVIKTAPDGKLVKNISGNIWEELDDNGNSLVPRQFIYDGDGSIGKDKKYSGDELACDRNGTITLSNGTFAKATANPLVFEEVNADGTPTTTPPTYLYTPTGDPNRPVGEGPMVTGQDGLPYIKTDNTTYINTVNDLVIITPDASTLPGGDGDVVQTRTWPSVATRAIKFRVLPIPSQLPGATNVPIQVEFYDPSQEASAQPLRYLLVDNSVGNITISSSGQLAVSPTASTNATYTFYVIAADGSSATGSVNVQVTSILQSFRPTSISPYGPITVNKGVQTVLSVGTAPASSSINVQGATYAIQGSDLGCTLTSAGLLTAGDTVGTVTVQATVSCLNPGADPLDLQDGTGRTIAVGATYTMTTTFEVSVQDPPTYSAEAHPYVTKLTLLGVTSWDDVEPAPEYAGGNGSQGMPYQISSIRQLKKFATNKGANSGYATYFKLTADMNFDGADALLSGNLLGGAFQGNFDGGSHVIEGLNSNSALFSSLTYGTVQNLGRKGGVVATSGGSAFVVGLGNGGTLYRCYSDTPVNSTGVAAGLVLQVSPGGGIINNCYNTGAITGNAIVGGLVYVSQANAGTLTITNSYNAGALSGTGCGGIIGWVNMITSPNGQTIALDNVRNYEQIIGPSGSPTGVFGDIIGQLGTPTSPSFLKVSLTDVSYLPNLISFTGVGVQPDTDIGNRPVSPATWPAGVTVNGQGVNTLTGSAPTGFLVP